MASIISFFFGNNTAYPYALPMADGDVPVLPANTALPTISGATQVSQTLTCAPGTWTYYPAFTYQWRQSGSNIGGATAATYVPVSGDVGHTLDCVVTGTNLKGSVNATSAATAAITVGGVAPTNSTLPVVSGTDVVGSVLSATNGTWANTPTSYTYQWKDSGTNISGATANTYTLVSGDAGATVTCVVTATNSTGSASATSNGLGPITAGLACSYTPNVNATYNVAYTGATPSPSGGTSPYSYTVTGSLPPGMTMSSGTGIIQGTDSTDSSGASYPGIQIVLHDNVGNTVNCGSAFTITVAATAAPINYFYYLGF